MTQIKKLGHVVLRVRDPLASADWYGEVLGTELVVYHEGLAAAFLSFGTRDHDIALFKAPEGQQLGHQDLEHVAFEIDGDLDEFKAFRALLEKKGIEVLGTVDHGISYGTYFLDPDGHHLEVFYQRVRPDAEAKRTFAEIGALAGPIELDALKP